MRRSQEVITQSSSNVLNNLHRRYQRGTTKDVVPDLDLFDQNVLVIKRQLGSRIESSKCKVSIVKSGNGYSLVIV